MWKALFLLLALCLCINAKGHAKKKNNKAHNSHAEWIEESENDEKRDAIALPVYTGYQQPQYPAATKSVVPVNTNYNKAAIVSSTLYNAASTNTYTATQRAAVASPKAAPAPAPAAPAPVASAPAPAIAPAAPAAAPAAVAAPATAAVAPAPAPAPAPAAAAPAPAPVAPAPAAPAPAPAAAYPSPAPAAAYPSPAPAPAPVAAQATNARSDFPSPYAQTSSYSSSFYVNPPAAAPAPAPAPAPAYYAAAPAPAPAPAPAAAAPASATTTLAAAVAQAATSTAAFSDLLKGKDDKSKVAKGVCSDDTRADNFCRKANNPCFCEENHHFMYNYCKRSCSWCDASVAVGHRFWRVVNSAILPRSWIVKEIEFFSDKHSKNPIKINPVKAYASTSYPGYLASNAFDGNDDTYWLPEGWYERYPGMDYIGIQFDQPVVVGSVRIKHQNNEKNATSTKMYLEGSDFYENNYFKAFTMENPKKKEDKRYTTVDCPTYWRRMENNDDVYCLKTTAEFLTWQQARDKCASYGADLLSISSPGENMFINNELRLCGFTWIGLNDRKNESNFGWTDGKPLTFKSWAGDESYYEQDEYLNSKQNCVAASRTGEWRPFHCDDKFYSVCKLKLKMPDDDEIEDMEKKGHYHHTRVSKKSHKSKSKQDEDEEDDEVSGNLDAEASGLEEENSEDAIKEIKKNIKKAVKTTSKKHDQDKVKEEEEEDEDEDDDDSGSTSERSASTIAKPHRKEEIENIDDTYLDLKH